MESTNTGFNNIFSKDYQPPEIDDEMPIFIHQKKEENKEEIKSNPEIKPNPFALNRKSSEKCLFGNNNNKNMLSSL